MLKRRTPQNIVWGGAAGCMPVLIGWAAVTGSLDWAPVILFGIVFLWTPPHYWPLSMRYKEEYAAVSVPMLAVVRGTSTVGLAGRALRLGDRRVLAAAHPDRVRWACCTPSSRRSREHGSSSRRTGSTRTAIRGGELKPMRVFHASITYLTLVFLAVGLDPLLHLPIPL